MRALSKSLPLAAVLAVMALPAFAQTNVCEEGQKLLTERQTLMGQWAEMVKSGKKIDPRPACTVLTKVANNSNATLKWLDTNKDWCQVPEGFVNGFKQSHDGIIKTRGQACDVAAKMAEAQKKAAQAQRSGGAAPGMLGGGGLTGEYKIPQGAL
jgi:hypothetical protein